MGDFIALDRAGFQIEICTLLGQQGSFHQPETEVFRGRVHRASFLSPLLLWENIKAWFRPVTWRLLCRIIAGTLARPMELFKNCCVFPQAIYFAHLVSRKEITHIHAAWASYPTTVAWIVSELSGIPFSFSSHAHDIYKVRSLLREKLAPEVSLSFEWHQIALHEILEVRVGASNSLVSLIESGEIFRRVGATNRKIRPDDAIAARAAQSTSGADQL